jgi:hypothetical protein
VKHGYYAKSPVVPGLESREDWERHREGLITSLQPEGHFELLLVERLADLLWRLDRLGNYERACIVYDMYEAADEDLVSRELVADAGTTPDSDAWIRQLHPDYLIPHERTLQRIARFSDHLQRLWVQTLNQLHDLQARRRALDRAQQLGMMPSNGQSSGAQT